MRANWSFSGGVLLASLLTLCPVLSLCCSGRYASSITKEEVECLFDLPAQAAAQRLGVCT